MAVVKIIELVGSSTTSSDDAVQSALADAKQTLRNIKAVGVTMKGRVKVRACVGDHLNLADVKLCAGAVKLTRSYAR